MNTSYTKNILLYFLTFVFLTVICQIILHKLFESNYFIYSILSVITISGIGIFLTQKMFLSNNKLIEDLRAKNHELTVVNERYEIVAKATSDTIWDLDLKANYILWNKGIVGIFGYKEKDIEHTNEWWFSKVHPEDTIHVSEKLYSFVEMKDDKWRVEYRFQCADGTYKYILDRGFLVKDDTGKVIRMIGAMQDVTQRKKEEQRLKLLETAITQSKESIMISEINEDKSKVPKIVFVNQAFFNITGYKTKDVIGNPATLFLTKDAVRDDISKINDALKKKTDFTFEGLNQKKSGEEYWVNFSMIPIVNYNNKYTHWISTHRDVTVEKQREKEREQLILELTQNNKDLKQFSYITSHNLRAPLSNLTGIINLIEDIEIEDEELRELINGFTISTLQLNQTINDLMKVIIIKDKPSIEKEELSVLDTLEKVKKQVSSALASKNPIINTDISQDVIYGNSAYFESILLNLVTNSLKYSKPDTQLKINISCEKNTSFTVFRFKDNGIGIDLYRNRDKIFGLYQRFHDIPDSKGLGLYLVKSQVESMGGTISVDSEVNVGTTFKITFKNN